MAQDPRYHVTLADPVSGESLGLILEGGLQMGSAQQMAAMITESQDVGGLQPWSVIEQKSYHHGRGLEFWDSADPERYYDAYNMDTRFRDQLTLAPAVFDASASTDSNMYSPTHTPGEWPLLATGSQQKYSMSFSVAGAGNYATTKISLRLRTAATSGTVTVRIETDTAGSPSGTLASANATKAVTISGTISDLMAWVLFTFTSFNLTKGATVYHVVVSTTATTAVYVHAAKTNVYAAGASKVYNGSAWLVTYAYGAMPYGLTSYGVAGDIYFLLGDQTNLSGTVSCGCQFNGKIYVGAGTAVYEWDNTNSVWVASKTDFGAAVTDMADFGGVLWVAQSDGNAWTFDATTTTTTWTEKSGITCTWLLVNKGYLYRAGLSTTNNVYYTNDGTTWNTNPWKVGNPGRLERITGLGGVSWDVYVATTHGLYFLGPDSLQNNLIDQYMTWTSQYDVDNGKGIVCWSRDSKLYFPVQHGLLGYSDGLLESVGPDMDAGLPSGRQGNIVDMVALTNWLIAALDAGTGTSSVLVYNGTGWHELFRCPQGNASCRAVWYDTTVSPNRLWFGYGPTTAYITYPDVTDNPYEAGNVPYASQGHLVTPWMDADLLLKAKDYQEEGLIGEIPAGGSVGLYYEIDNYGAWTALGSALTSTPLSDLLAFPFTPAFATNPTVAGNSTTRIIQVTSGETSNLAAGNWVRINDEVRQVASVTDGDSFVLVAALTNAPASGDTVYPARPAGRQIRFKIELSTSDTDASPNIQRWWHVFMALLADKLAPTFTTIIEDHQSDLAGTEIAETAEVRAARLHSFAKRPNPLWLTDMRGTRRTVKVNAIQETQENYRDVSEAPVVRSRFSVTTLEV